LLGTPQSEAKQRYVELVKTLLPDVKVVATETRDQPVQDQKIMQEQRAEPPRPRCQARGLLLQLLSWLAVVATLLLFAVKVLLPWGKKVVAHKMPDDLAQYEELGQSLSPLLWFALGYSLVLLMGSKVRSLRLLDCSL
jgi:hypothetical protein